MYILYNILVPHFRLRVLKVTTTTGRRNHLAKVRGENSQSRATLGENQGQPENSKDKQKSCGFHVVNADYSICWDVFFVGWSDLLGWSKKWRNDSDRHIFGITESYLFLACEYFFLLNKISVNHLGMFFSVFVFFFLLLFLRGGFSYDVLEIFIYNQMVGCISSKHFECFLRNSKSTAGKPIQMYRETPG